MSRRVLRPRSVSLTRALPRGLALGLWLGLWLFTGAARAQGLGDGDNGEPPAAAVIPFGAPLRGQADRINTACEQALQHIKGLKIIRASQWEKEAKESGQGDDLEAMARRLGADVLITGSLTRVKDAWRLSIDVFDDKGMPIESTGLDLLVPELGPAAIYRLEEALARIVRPAVGLHDKAPEPQGIEEPSPQDVDREKPTQLAQVEGIRQKPPEQKKIEHPPWLPVIEAKLGLLVAGRTLGCGDADPRRLNQPCTETQFPLAAGAGLRLDLGVFPLGRLSVHPALAGLGVSFLLELPGWQERLQTDGTALSVRDVRVEGGVKWRWNIGNAVRRPILEVGAAVGYHVFSLAGNTAPFPDLQATYILPTLGLSSFLTSRLLLRAAVGIQAVLGAGDFTEPANDSNQNPFGAGSGLGVRATLEGEFLVWRGLSVGLGGYLERTAYSFDGTGCTKSVSQQVPCDRSIVRDTPPPPGVSSATDLYLGFFLQAGYRY